MRFEKYADMSFMTYGKHTRTEMELEDGREVLLPISAVGKVKTEIMVGVFLHICSKCGAVFYDNNQ